MNVQVEVFSADHGTYASVGTAALVLSDILCQAINNFQIQCACIQCICYIHDNRK